MQPLIINICIVLSLILLLLFIHTHSQTIPTLYNTAKLSTSQPSSNNATITILNTNDVSIINNSWDISVNTQIGFHILLDLSSISWGFHPTLDSIITLSINSNTLPTSPDKDLILSFTVNNNQYFTIFLIIDNNGGNGIWPRSGQPLATGSVNTFVNRAEAFGKYDRQSKASEGTGTNSLTPNNYIDGVLNQWPIIISIENRPSVNNVYVSLQPNSGNSKYMQQCIFTSSFTANQGMQIYIGGDDNTDDLISLNAFLVQYTVDLTMSPTPSPTINPIPAPTDISTPKPTQTPTNNPISLPTDIPSNNPSINPSKNPTINPTKFPSKTPTITNNPTSTPTLKPTLLPTDIPSINPTNFPSAIPTESIISDNPTASPTDIPSNNPSINPSKNPTINSTKFPSKTPTITNDPTSTPTSRPTLLPTHNPTNIPSSIINDNTTASPTYTTSIPTSNPSTKPSKIPTINPTKYPSVNPSINPTSSPPQKASTNNPSVIPTTSPPTPSPSTNTPTISTQTATNIVSNQPTSASPSTSTTYNPTTSISTRPSFHYIDCDENDKCSLEHMVCQNDMDCIIECIGNNACQQANITCPMNAHCQLNCGGHSDDCKQLSINAKQSKSLNITCGNGPESCDRMNVYCPINNNGGIGCSISGLNGNNVDSVIHLYAVQGLTDINITDDGGKQGSTVVAIHILCTDDYSKECYITGTNIFNACINGDEICNDYITTRTGIGITDKPTKDYYVVTPRPTQRPSVVQSAASSRFGTNGDDDIMIIIILVLILVIVLLICCGISCMQCVGINCDGFYMIYIVLLRVIDVITDIILSDHIVTYVMGNKFDSNLLLIIAFGSVICIVVPYTVGLVSIHWIYNIPTDTASVRPQQWFKKYIVAFFLFFLITNDTYLLIELFSSGLFGSDIFDSGHTIIEKQEIKIFKILSIITGNVPQIVIQCIFGWIIYCEQELEIMIIILLAVSIISNIFVIVTFIRLQIKNNKFMKKEHILFAYQLKVKLMKIQKNTKSEKHQLLQIKKYRGNKKELRDEFASILRIKRDELQIGHIQLIDDGCFINLVQCIPMTTNNQQYIEYLYKNRSFAETIEDIFHLEWSVAVKLVLNETTEINKQITLEEIELALTHNLEINDDCLNDKELNNIFNAIKNGESHHHYMPSTDIINSNNIQIDNISQALHGNEFDTESISLQYNNNNNNKQYHLQIIPSKSTTSPISPISISTMKYGSPIIDHYDEEHYRQIFKMVDNPSNSSNKYEAEEEKIEIDDEDEYEYEDEYYDEDDDDDDDDIDINSDHSSSNNTAPTHASGDCSQYSPYLLARKNGARKIKYLHPQNNNNNDNDVPSLDHNKESVKSQKKKYDKKCNVTYFD